MAINLQKGQRIGIGLQKVGVGLGWDSNTGTGYDFDLDASAFMLGDNGKLPQDEFFVFYNNQHSPDRYELDEDFSTETAVEFGRLYRHNGEWKFEAMGNGFKGGLQYLVNKYVG